MTQPGGVAESYRRTYANRQGRDFSWRSYSLYARAALVAAFHAGASGAEDALAACEAAIGSYPWERNPGWAFE